VSRGPAAIAARQQARLQALIEHARGASRFYAEHYRTVPPGPIGRQELHQLPPVIKPELMARFDDWVTDPAVTRVGVEEFVANLDNLGRDFLDRYVVFTTSGSTGVPALLVQDHRAVAVMTGLAYVRGLSALSPKLAAKLLTRPPRVAAVFAQGGHFLSTTMFERRLRTARFRRRISRFFSVLDPLPVLVDQLNAFRPAMLGTYASALSVLTEEQEARRLHIAPLVITSGGELFDTGDAASRRDCLPLPGNPVIRRLGSHAARAAVPTRPTAPQQRLVRDRADRRCWTTGASRKPIRRAPRDESRQLCAADHPLPTGRQRGRFETAV
jgi:phenylacetate-coenzyme A ligase PaaK-like adenylate-forming protein